MLFFAQHLQESRIRMNNDIFRPCLDEKAVLERVKEDSETFDKLLIQDSNSRCRGRHVALHMSCSFTTKPFSSVGMEQVCLGYIV